MNIRYTKKIFCTRGIKHTHGEVARIEAHAAIGVEEEEAIGCAWAERHALAAILPVWFRR